MGQVKSELAWDAIEVEKALENGIALARYGHHPEPLIDFLIECEEIESIADAERKNLTDFGWEEDRAKLDERIDRALQFRVGGDEKAVEAKHAVREIARERGFILNSEVAYEGQPCPRLSPSPISTETGQ